MTPQQWNPDDASVISVEDTDIARPWRYGVTGWESSHGEPFDVALAQELPDADVDVDKDDERWTEVDADEPFSGRLLSDEKVRDDDFAVAVTDSGDFSPEELAMHVVEMWA